VLQELQHGVDAALADDDAGGPDGAVGLVESAVEGDAGVGLGDAFAADDRGRAVVA
jgi:hypothetical protein